jgi:6-phosphogluconolactonase
MATGKIEVSTDKRALFENTAKLISDAAHDAIARQGRFSFVLTGGSTPKGLYELLASDAWRSRIEWSKVHLFWGDERFVPATDAQSNYGMAKAALIDRIKLPAQNIHRIVTENTTPDSCASNYEADIREFFSASRGTFPSFDVVLNGMGSNRHVLSLFPGRPTLHEKSKLVVADYIPEVSIDRITMTAPLVNAAREVVMLVAGSDKAEALRDVLYGPQDVENKPAQLIDPGSGKLIWMLDRDAAAQLPAKDSRL